ncbi:MAG: substrate-binding domain-containing protein [Planctomycetes bacterium]|nr:substrate-binding domain-containing protein [Planctomycetota bacterium]
MAKRPRVGRPQGHTSRYKLIQADMLDKLQSGRWPPGRPLPSSRQLARQYKISHQMIHIALKALAKDGWVRLADRRLAVATVSAPLSRVMEKSIALVVTAGLRALADESNSRGQLWNALVPRMDLKTGTLVILQDTRWRKEFPAGLRELPLNGVLLLGPFHHELARQYEALDLPVVLLDQPAEGLKIHAVALENVQAAADAVSRLAALGHRRIAFVRNLVTSTQKIDPDSKEREAGFIAACKKLKLKDVDYKIFTGIGSRAQGSIDIGQQLLRAHPPFTAVLAADDTLAAGIVLAVEMAGLKVPQDLSLAVFHAQYPGSHNWSGPRADFSLMAAPALDLLVRKPRLPQHVRIPTHWHEGTTTGPAAV